MKIRLEYWPNDYVTPNGDIRKIQMIKDIRAITGMGLKEAKCEVVDLMVDHCSPMIEVTYNQYRSFIDKGFGVKIISHDTKTQLIEHLFDVQRQLLVHGKVGSAKKMVEVIADVMDSDYDIPF